MSESSNTELVMQFLPAGPKGKFQVVTAIPGGGAVVNEFRLADAAARERYADMVCTGRPGLNRAEILQQLDNEAAAQALKSPGAAAKPTQAAQLVEMVMGTDGVELFHTPFGEAFVTIPVGAHFEHYKVTSSYFEAWLRNKFYAEHEKPCGSQGVRDAIATLAGKAIHEGKRHSVEVRVAQHEGDVWIDIGDEERRAARVDARGWTVVPATEVPVKFARTGNMAALPIPEHGGSVDLLRPLVNMPDNDSFVLFIGFLVGSLNPLGPYGILSVSGEHGCAKSTICKFAVRLIDPRKPDLRRPPRNERDLFISACRARVVALNNVSGLKADISDALCVLAVDGGFSTRKLYTDEDEALFDGLRPVILNGIEEPASQPDLVDRCIAITLRAISKRERRQLRDINREFERVRPLVFGALLDAVSSAIRNLPNVNLVEAPRMADLAAWVTAAEEGLGWVKGTFMAAYTGNRLASQTDAVLASPVGAAIYTIAEQGGFRGTAAELLASMNRARGDGPVPQDWPKSPRGVAGAVRRLAPGLREIGVDVVPPEGPTGHANRRLFTVTNLAGQCVASVAPEAVADSEAELVPSPEEWETLQEASATHAIHATHQNRDKYDASAARAEVAP